MKILITGANGFIAKNLITHLQELNFDLILFGKGDLFSLIEKEIESIDFIFHLAGVNRPLKEIDFTKVNYGLTEKLILLIKKKKRKIPILFSSSIQAEEDNPYGNSKLKAENLLKEFHKNNGSPVYIFRLKNIFGKWAKPNYNSVVATYCFNVINDIPIIINKPNKTLSLTYIDDLIGDFLNYLQQKPKGIFEVLNKNYYTCTVNDLASKIKSFKNLTNSGLIDSVGEGLIRALYATFLSYYPTNLFFRSLTENIDKRGKFVEILKTKNSGQISYFTANPGITRGDHYHHTKNEKFVVVQGKALFKFRHILTGEIFEKHTTSINSVVVDSIPGWAHSISNIGNDLLIVILWSNEVFNINNPDTFSNKV